jgi:hypothetical protein
MSACAESQQRLNNTKPSIMGTKRFTNAQVPLDTLLANRFAQVRGMDDSDYEDIPQLAEQIAEAGGLLNPITIALFTHAQLKQWDELVFSMYDVHKNLRQCRKLNGTYPVPIAGRRRLSAIDYARRHGTQAWATFCESPLACFNYIFTNGLVDVRIKHDISVEEAMGFQLSENLSQRRPHPSREARAINDLWIMTKRKFPKLTKKEFVRRISVTISQLRVAVWLEQLPDDIRKEIYRKDIPWSNAVLLGKFFNALLSCKDLNGNLRSRDVAELEMRKHHGPARLFRAKKFEAYLLPFLKEVYGQRNLFAQHQGFDEFELVAERVQPVAISREVESSAEAGVTYFQKLIKALRQDLLLKDPASADANIAPLNTTGARGALKMLHDTTRTTLELALETMPSEEMAKLLSMLNGSELILAHISDLARHAEQEGMPHLISV